MSQDQEPLNLNLENLSINQNPQPSSRPTTGQSPYLNSVSPSSTQLNGDIKARLLAFQQKRTKPYTENSSLPMSPNQNPALGKLNMSNITGALSNHSQSQPQVNQIAPMDLNSSPAQSGKPLPPLPNPMQMEDKRSLSANNSGHPGLIPSPQQTPRSFLPVSTPSQHLHGVDMEYMSPEPTHVSRSPLPTDNFATPSPPQTSEFLKKKPSLSERRKGMTLNMSDIHLSPASPGTLSPPINLNDHSTMGNSLASNSVHFNDHRPSSPAPLNTTGGLSRRISERKNKPSFKLNLDASNSDLPQHQISDSAASNNFANSLNSGSSSDTQSSKKPQLQGLFANYSKYVDIKSGQLNFAGKASLHSKGVDFLSGSSFRISLDELELLQELGHGNYGCVLKVLHKPTGVLMAMKEVRLELDETKFTQILMELEILHKCDSPYIVDFYGAFFVEGAVYMCMEYMDGGSLDNIYGKDRGVGDEASLAYITECVIRGLKELKDTHYIIHRDVKPTNILVNTHGKVKLCDFGVSGNLVASLAKTNIGCQSYMAPERIKSLSPDDATYSVQSDVWSLGLTILEVAAGHYPYPAETYGNIFSQLSAIVDGDPPKLDSSYSREARMFVNLCLNKNPDLRPSYAALLNNPWLVKYRDVDPHMDVLVTARVKEIEETKPSISRSNSSKKPNPSAMASANRAAAPPNIENVQSLLRNKVKAPALHRGGLSNTNRNFISR